jgi:hypothetical protein
MSDDRESTTVHIRIPKEDRDVITEMAKKDYRSFISMVQVILRKAALEYKDNG